MTILKGYKIDETFGDWMYFEQYKSPLDGKFYYSKYELVRDQEKIKLLEEKGANENAKRKSR